MTCISHRRVGFAFTSVRPINDIAAFLETGRQLEPDAAIGAYWGTLSASHLSVTGRAVSCLGLSLKHASFAVGSHGGKEIDTEDGTMREMVTGDKDGLLWGHN